VLLCIVVSEWSLGNKQMDALNVLVCFEMEFGREVLAALRADNGAGRANR
jgi:hypothetical protein